MSRSARRFAQAALGIGVAWIIFAALLAPWLIRAAYAERLIPVLNDIVGGRDLHPVEFYLGAWRSVALALSAVFVVLVAAVAGWILAPDTRRTVIDRLLGAADGLTPLEIVKVGVVAGLCAGWAEAGFFTIRQLVTQRPAALFHIEIWWMAPLSAAFVGLLIGLVIALVSLGGRRRLALRAAAVVFGFMVVHSVMQSEGIPLYPAAEVMLSLGLATVLSRIVMAREGVALRLVRRASLLIVVGAVAIGSTAWVTLPATIDARAVRALPAAAEGLPNVLIIIFDTSRAANFSLHGYSRETSPVLDDWSRSGVIFDRGVATSSWTFPSHSSLFTAQHNHVLGVGLDQPLAESYTTLAESLRDLGYHTGGFAANPVYTTAASGLAQGFARYEDRPWELPQFLRASWLSRLMIAPGATRLFPGLVERNVRADHITDRFLGWAQERDGERPFFAFLNYFDAHSPYQLVPADQADRFGPTPDEDWNDFVDRFYDRGDSVGIDRWINRYDASIAYIDGEIGRIRRWLTESGSLDNTLVIVTSDHGDMWGEQSELGHAESLFAPLVHIPMFASYPNHLPRGLRIDEPVSLLDMPRSVFDLIAAEAPPEFGGSSFVPLVHAPDDGPPRYALSELWPLAIESIRTDHLLLGPIKSVIDRRYQYIRYGDGSEQLFDLELDYGELHNLVGDSVHAVDLIRLRQVMDSIGGRW